MINTKQGKQTSATIAHTNCHNAVEVPRKCDTWPNICKSLCLSLDGLILILILLQLLTNLHSCKMGRLLYHLFTRAMTPITPTSVIRQTLCRLTRAPRKATPSPRTNVWDVVSWAGLHPQWCLSLASSLPNARPPNARHPICTST